MLNHLRTTSFSPSVNFSTNRLIFVRPLRAVILFIWEQLSRPSPLYEKREWHNGRSSLHPLQCRHIGGLSCWFLFMLRGFSSGAPVYFSPKKTNIPNSTRTGNSGPEEPLRGMFGATLQLSFPPLSLWPNDQILSTQNKPAHFPRVLAIWRGRLTFINSSHNFSLIFVSLFVFNISSPSNKRSLWWTLHLMLELSFLFLSLHLQAILDYCSGRCPIKSSPPLS